MLENAFNTQNEKGFHYPGRILSGAGTRNKIPELIRGHGPTVVVTDSLFAADPLLDDINPVRRITVAEEPNEATLLSTIVEIPKDTAWIVAVGGGSTIDTAKAIAAYLRFGKLRIRDESAVFGAPHLIAAPTTAGSGSETSRFFIMSDKDTGQKVSIRSWANVPELAVLDPYFLANSPASTIALGAFDAFVHLWETFVCRNERSPFTDAYCLGGLPQILRAIHKLQNDNLTLEDILALQQASSAGGVVISNVRTGMVHTLGEALSSQLRIAHPASLFVFFPIVLRSYASEVQDRITQLDIVTQSVMPEFGPVTIETLCGFWNDVFEQFNLMSDIQDLIATSSICTDDLLHTIARDTVLAKENPIDLKDKDIQWITETSLKRFTVSLQSDLVAAIQN